MPLRDETAVVLDFLPKGHATGRPEALVQLLGDRYFTLLEAVAREGVTVKHGDKVYIGDAERKEIDHIKRRITLAELTTFARSELPFMIEKIVRDNEQRYVEFYNKSQPISTRVHQLELLPGIGKKHMFDIIGERKKAPFKNFDDIKDRIKLLPDPAGLIVKRILKEIENENERFRLFVLGPPMRRF
jgi:putative nucleotide binding protein